MSTITRGKIKFLLIKKDSIATCTIDIGSVYQGFNFVSDEDKRKSYLFSKSHSFSIVLLQELNSQTLSCLEKKVHLFLWANYSGLQLAKNISLSPTRESS